jgi:DNA-binding transcriptional regulator GbsR (MarR family)
MARPEPDARVTARLARARDRGVETCGRIAAFWGFTHTMGRIFGLLYLSPEPLAQVQIQQRLDISVGSASMTLAALGRWGVVHRIPSRGERRERYRAETDFWKMISGVLDQRERQEIAAAIKVVEKAKADASAARASTRGSRRADADFVAERLARLHDVCQLGQTLLDMLLGQLKLDVGRFRDVLRAGPDGGAVEGASRRAAESEVAARRAVPPKKRRPPARTRGG